MGKCAIIVGFYGKHSSVPGLGRSPEEGKDFPLQYSGLENSMDCIVHGVTKSQTRLSDFHFTSLHFMEIIQCTPLTPKVRPVGEDEDPSVQTSLFP